MSRGKHPWWKPRRSRRAQRWALLVVVIALGLAAWALHRAYTRMVAYPERPGTGSAEIIEVEIPSGASFTQVLELLVDRVVQRSTQSVRVVDGLDRTQAQTLELRASGDAHIQATHALIDGKNLVKMDGGQIHLG